MEDSTNTLLYTATYVFIFVIALSISITLLFSVNKYADSAFNYKQGLQSSIIDTPTTGSETANKVTLSAEDVISYYYNYVKRDIYADNGGNVNSDVTYKVGITIDGSTIDLNTDEKLALTTINSKDTYYLRYKSSQIGEDGKKTVTVDISNQ